jgi:hypothetical protein
MRARNIKCTLGDCSDGICDMHDATIANGGLGQEHDPEVSNLPRGVLRALSIEATMK